MLTWLQLSGGTFPTGDFNHSYGLETYIQTNRITTASEIEQLLQAFLEVSIHFDAIFVKEAYEATQLADAARLDEIQNIYSASKLTKEVYEASMKTGKSLLTGVINLSDIDDFPIHYHYAIGYGIMAKKLDLPLWETVQTYLFSSMISLVSVATRIMPLGQKESQLMLYRLGKSLAELPLTEEDLSLENVNTFSPGFEIASMEHETLYTRLCMS
ncbi:urease accessory UreF family protein [Oceanobacillus sp. FSL K6-2867]|uniref:urease accessory protein UreF n=1 Tax=Oceanobacillus sp. FSL K6-2867 TaxID=2954748 RepID=UPI0030D95899